MGYADCVPNPRTDQSALENSLKAVYGTKDKAVVSRKQPKRNGVELVNIERDTMRNSYVTNFGAKVKYAVGCTSGFGDFTYRKPNRRQPAGGALLPAHVKPVPRVTVVVDTSGSMKESDLALALGVIGNALRSLPDPRGLRVLVGDTAVACAKNVFRPEQIELSGDGGTDMSAMILAACEERPAPKAILVVTDGYTGWPDHPVVPRVVACLTRPRPAQRAKAGC